MHHRHEYVPDATQHPVAYGEGIYVEEGCRHQGVGKVLIHHAKRWTREQGCVELASDALIDNTADHAFHTHLGFHEVDRVVFFVKPIGTLS